MQATEKKSNNKIWLAALSVGVVIAIILGIVALVNHGDTKANAIPTINQQVDNIKNTLPELEKVSTELKGYIYTLETTTEKLQSDLAATNTAIDTLETEVYGKVDAEKTATLNQLKADKTELEGKIAAANKAIEDAKAANTASEKTITDQIAALQAELEKADADNKKALEDSIAALETALTKADADNKKALEDSIAALKTAMEASDASLTTAIQTLNTNLSALIKTNADNIAALQNTARDLQSKIDATNDALAALESDLQAQITASEQKVLNELNALKTDIEGQITTVKNTIATLQTKDAELDQKIADLKTYVDSEITATEDWATAIFATLEQYEETQTAISEINALIKSTQESIITLEEKLNNKIANDIAAAVVDVNSDIATKVTEITNGYTAAITDATNAITEAYTNAIKTAITDCENAMREWVNGVLADGYYQKAEIDGKITALQTQVAEGDTAHQKEIDDLKAALAKAESDLTAAYEKAIEDAITENNGKITEEITDAVATAQDNLQAQIDAITGEIEKIKARLDIIEADISSIHQQIANINVSIDALKAENEILKTEINCLKGIHIPAEYYGNLDGTHTYTCDGCGKDITESHNFVNNKCVCGATENGEDSDMARKCLHEVMDKGICKECDTICYVDLGLPSGKLWATYNVGADNPWDYGDYFAWGETSPKTSYTWDNYVWGTKNDLTKYNATDGKTTLEADDDAASVNMGAGWRTPTLEDWDELSDHCTWEWTTVNGVSGYTITGNGNSIFLPATGRLHSLDAKNQGTEGCYWMNSRNYYDYDLHLGMAFKFDSSGVNSYIIERMIGMCVRAVYSENN